MPLIVALDQGTTATTAIAVDEERTIVARVSEPTPLERPSAGWAENDPGAIREAVSHVLVRIAHEIDPDEVVALGITNQRETSLAWDPSTGEAYTKAISWQCRRTAPLCAGLRSREGLADRIRARTGLVVDPYFSATKWRWMLENVPEVARAEEQGTLLLGTVDAFLLHSLTGEHRTDPSNASRTMVYDLHEGGWSFELAEELGVPIEALPEVRPSSGKFGEVSPGTTLGSELEPYHGVPILGVAGDQQAALFGHGCLEPGEAKGTLGTGAFFLVNTGSRPLEPPEGLLGTVAWDLGEGLVHAVEGAAFACGSALEWASSVGLLASPGALDETAAETSDGATFVPALYGLGAPHWDADARGVLAGLSAATTRGHIARAIAEGLAAQNGLLLRALAASGQEVRELRLDGGVSRSDLLCRLLADATGVRVLRSAEADLTALGAAGLAGLAAGVWGKEDVRPEPGAVFEQTGHDGFVTAYEAAVARVLAG